MPLPEIRTNRLLLRSFRREDAAALHALWTAPEVRRYLWDDVIIASGTVREIVEAHLDTELRLGIGFWTIALLGEPPIIGFCGFRPVDSGPEIELLYGLRGEHWGGGLATEACLAAIEYLWRSTDYPRVYARADPPNDRSIQLLRRLGMAHEPATATMAAYSLPRPRAWQIGSEHAK